MLLVAGANLEAKDEVRGGGPLGPLGSSSSQYRGDGRRCGCGGCSMHRRVVCCFTGRGLMVVFGEPCDLEIGLQYRRSCTERRFGTNVAERGVW